MLFFSVGFDLLAAAHHTPPNVAPIGCHNNVGPRCRVCAPALARLLRLRRQEAVARPHWPGNEVDELDSVGRMRSTFPFQNSVAPDF